MHTSKTPEPFGRTIIENMFSEIPVFATDMGGALDIITHKENGFLYNYKNYKEVTPLIKDIKSNNKVIDKLIHNAKMTIIKKFSGSEQIKIIEQIYNNIG